MDKEVMRVKLKTDMEIGMYYDGKRKNLSDHDIEVSILLLRAICDIEKDTKRKITIVKI